MHHSVHFIVHNIDTLNVPSFPYLSLMYGAPSMGPLLRDYNINLLPFGTSDKQYSGTIIIMDALQKKKISKMTLVLSGLLCNQVNS